MGDRYQTDEQRDRLPARFVGGGEILADEWAVARANTDPWSDPASHAATVLSERPYGGGLSYPFAGQRVVPEHCKPARPYTNRFAPAPQVYPAPEIRGYTPGGYHNDQEQPQTMLVPYGERQLSVPMRQYLAHLREESNSWILIGIVGFFLGFGLISGPLTWKKGADIREAYQRNQLEPSPEANVAYYTGMLSTMLVGVSIVFLILMFGLIGL